jgi:hypothetical protein
MMAVYVEIRRDRETEVGFVYRYVASDGSVGRLEIAKVDGSSRPVEIASGDREERFYTLAARKLLKHFQAGEFPEETCWAS